MKAYISNSWADRQGEINKKQHSVIREILLSGLWVLDSLINRFGFMQAKGWCCFQTQEALAESLNVDVITIKRTVKWMVSIGILRIKKVRYKNNQWLHNEYWLDPIMFTQLVVEALYGRTKHHFFKKYFSLSSVTLIELNSPLFQGVSGKNKVLQEKYPQQTQKSSMWDNLLLKAA